MPEYQPSAEEMLRHKVPPRLKLVGIVALCILGVVVVWGLVSRVVDAHSLDTWTDEQAVPTVQVIALGGGQAQQLVLPGTIHAFTDAPIYAQVSGYVKKWDVDIGTPVKKGQLLAELDPRSYQAALDQARGQLARDAATLANAKVDLGRYQALAAQNAISSQQLATQQATVAADAGVVETDNANLQSAAINLGYTRIIAPFDGIVTSRSVDVGALVTVGIVTATPLFTVTDQTRLRIYVSVPQNYVAAVRPGMTATFTVPEHPGQSFTALVTATSEAVSSATGTAQVQLQIDNSDKALSPGDYAQLHFNIPAVSAAVRVPSTAVVVRETGLAVATVSKDSRVVITPITVTRDLGNAVEVGSGLRQGDQVIDNPSDSLAPGDLVHVSTRRPTLAATGS